MTDWLTNLYSMTLSMQTGYISISVHCII